MRAQVIFAALVGVLPAIAQAQALTKAEKAAFRTSVAQCWNVGALEGAAKTAVVTVTFDLDRAGKPVADSLALVGAGKDTSTAVRDAYQAARRAILRCGSKGLKLPLEKYDQWRSIELTFNPERMHLR